MRNSVNCRVDEVRYFVKIDVVRVDQVGCSLGSNGLELDRPISLN